MGKCQQKVNQAVMLNKNMENLKSIADQADSGLGTANSHFFYAEKSQFSGMET